MSKKKGIIIFFIVFIFIFTSVGLGFISNQVFSGEEVQTVVPFNYPCPNIDITKSFSLNEPVEGSTTGAMIVTPVYKKNPGELIINKTLPVGTNFAGKLAINLNTVELNVVKGAFIFLWIILIVFVIGSIAATSRL